MIQFYNERIKGSSDQEIIGTNASREDKLRFMTALLKSQRPKGKQNQALANYIQGTIDELASLEVDDPQPQTQILDKKVFYNNLYTTNPMMPKFYVPGKLSYAEFVAIKDEF